LGYLTVSFPSSLTRDNRRQLHALAKLTGLECISMGCKSERRLKFGYNADCDLSAELSLEDKGGMSASDICAILNANFGMSMTEDDIT